MKPSLSPARRRFLEFVGSVSAVHIVAIAIYYAADVAHASAGRQRIFAWAWMGLTIAVIFVGLRRMRRRR